MKKRPVFDSSKPYAKERILHTIGKSKAAMALAEELDIQYKAGNDHYNVYKYINRFRKVLSALDTIKRSKENNQVIHSSALLHLHEIVKSIHEYSVLPKFISSVAENIIRTDFKKFIKSIKHA